MRSAHRAAIFRNGVTDRTPAAGARVAQLSYMLVTGNVKHFGMVPGIKLETWV